MLNIINLTKHYKGSDKGVTDLTLHIEKGDIYAFIGHNGAGKTTTLKCIAGIHSIDTGSIVVDGIDTKEDFTAIKKVMAYIPDSPEVYDYLTGVQYLNFIADIYAIDKAERVDRIQKYADMFEITKALGNLISSYSHGMKQKLVIVSALIHEPKLLILDEPFVGLDPKSTMTLKKEMANICKNGGAVFFSTHILEVAEKLCNKVAIVKDGRLIISGQMKDVVKDGQSLEDIFLEV